MKILYVITCLGGGGAEKVVSDLADQMYQRGHQVKIAYLKDSVVVRPENNAIELVCLGLEQPIHFYQAYRKYKKLLQIYQPDVVHSHMVHANIFVRLSRFFYNVKRLICTAHNANEGGSIRMLAYQLTRFLSDQDTNVSQEATQKFIELKAFNHKAITIYNGINLKKFKYHPEGRRVLLNTLNIDLDEKIFLSIGRLNAQKDYPNLINAISILKHRTDITKIKFIIVGDGDLRQSIQELIEKLGLSYQVLLLGRRDDISHLISAADFFVLPSAYEGFGLVVAEAMACETFTIATDCGGVKEVMGGNGLLIPPHNSEALASAMQQALMIPLEKRKTNNQNALKHVQQNFDLNNIVEQWITIYDR